MAKVTTIQPSSGRRWAYAAHLAGVVVVASSRSAVAGPPVANFDKVAHFAVYGLMGTLVLRGLGRRHWGWAVVIVSAFGASDEWHQHFTPGRSMDFADWVADTLGAALAVALYTGWKWYRDRLESGVLGGEATGSASPASEETKVSA